MATKLLKKSDTVSFLASKLKEQEDVLIDARRVAATSQRTANRTRMEIEEAAKASIAAAERETTKAKRFVLHCVFRKWERMYIDQCCMYAGKRMCCRGN